MCFGFSLSSSAQTKPTPHDYVIENGVKYVRVKTKGELLSLGVTVNGVERLVAAGGPKRGKPNKGCKVGKGTCKVSAYNDDGSGDDGGDDGELRSLTFVEQLDVETNKMIPAQAGLLAYYNAELDEVIFR